MEKTVTTPGRLLKRIREIPGAEDMTDSQLVSLCMEAGLAAAEREESATIRSILENTLSALSDEALVYVYRPIMYAYLWTDCHDHDRLTDDDMRRIHLSGMIAHGSPKAVERLDKWCMAVERCMGKEAHSVTLHCGQN